MPALEHFPGFPLLVVCMDGPKFAVPKRKDAQSWDGGYSKMTGSDAS